MQGQTSSLQCHAARIISNIVLSNPEGSVLPGHANIVVLMCSGKSL